MEAIVNLIMNTGVTVVIVAYFLWKDWKFNETTISVLAELRESMSMYKEIFTEVRELLYVIKTKVGVEDDSQG